MQESMNNQDQTLDPARDMVIKIIKQGPYLVCGNIPLHEKIITQVGGHKEYRNGRDLAQNETYALCRCGHTSTPPFCDGSHAQEQFQGCETASRAPFVQRAQTYIGEGLDLLDDGRCAFARFCHREEGDVWSLTKVSGDPHLREEAIKTSSECPAGRLLHIDEEGNEYEPVLAPEIWVLQDPEKEASSALYVKGGIALQSYDGTFYEKRNRYTLCRCGNSNNMPFCDAMHVRTHFHD